MTNQEIADKLRRYAKALSDLAERVEVCEEPCEDRFAMALSVATPFDHTQTEDGPDFRNAEFMPVAPEGSDDNDVSVFALISGDTVLLHTITDHLASHVEARITRALLGAFARD